MRAFLKNLFKGIGNFAKKVVAPVAAVAAPFIPGVGGLVAGGIGMLGGKASAGGGGTFMGIGGQDLMSAGGALYGANAARDAASAYASQAEKGATALEEARLRGLQDYEAGTGRAADELSAYFQGLTPQYRAEMDAVDGAFQGLAGTGDAATRQLAGFYGLNGEAGRRAAMEAFQASPGYQFQLSEGRKALENAAAARGNFFTSDAVKALQGHSQGLASQEYGNYLGGLERMSAAGQNAAANRISARGGLFQGLTGAGERMATGRADLFAGLGQNRASLNYNTAAARVPLYTGMGEMYGQGKMGAANWINQGIGDIAMNRQLQQTQGLFSGLGSMTPPVASRIPAFSGITSRTAMNRRGRVRTSVGGLGRFEF